MIENRWLKFFDPMMNFSEIKKRLQSKRHLLDEFVLLSDHGFSPRQISASWRPTETIPDDVRIKNYDTGLTEEEKQHFDAKTLDDRVTEHVTFLARNNKLIYPELKINQRIITEGKSKGAGSKPTSKKVFSDMDLQTWYYNKVQKESRFVHISCKTS